VSRKRSHNISGSWVTRLRGGLRGELAPTSRLPEYRFLQGIQCFLHKSIGLEKNLVDPVKIFHNLELGRILGIGVCRWREIGWGLIES